MFGIDLKVLKRGRPENKRSRSKEGLNEIKFVFCKENIMISVIDIIFIVSFLEG